MRILHVYKQYTPTRGGGITAAQSIIEGLRGRVESTVLAATHRGFGDRLRINGTDVHKVFSVGYFNSMPLAPTLPLWVHIHARQADIIHIHLPFPIADVAVNLWKLRIPVVLHWHSEIVQQRIMKKLLRPMLSRTLRRAHAIIVGSPRHTEFCDDLAPFLEKCRVIPYGIDLQFWQNPSEATQREIDTLRARYPRMVLFTGRLVAYKGLRYLLEAMTRNDADLVIIGDGPLSNALRAQADSLGIERRVHLLGEVSDSTLMAFYHACKVFVLPSIWPNEAFGLCQLEAMACRTPIVNTHLSTGVPWVARDGLEALTVATENSVELANAINRILDTPEIAAALAARGLDRVQSKFDRKHTNERIFGLYTELANI
ncbi:MAG: glycosyltransferase [Gammaproteobacteria bacterium]|nr:glycosyltransferase [Gammaproteobacteria bacterium]MDH3465448.1 glycosyltransferase [Gammaproteobacteria bacterium]